MSGPSSVAESPITDRRELVSAFGDTVSVQAFSGESKQGVEEARAVVSGWLGFQG